SSPAHYIPQLIEAGVASRRKLYEAINSGALKARKNGKRTVILDADLNNWLNSLPAYEPRQAA
ncbi:MAG: DNA-binding protein, partial [Devosia sp.]